MKKYYYNVIDLFCVEPCPIKPEIMIGSENCSRCEHFWKGGTYPHYKKGFIECEKLNEEISKP